MTDTASADQLEKLPLNNGINNIGTTLDQKQIDVGSLTGRRGKLLRSKKKILDENKLFK